MARPRIVVVGSVNLDLVVQVERLPQPGETVGGGTFARVPGVRSATAGSVPPSASLISFGTLAFADRAEETKEELMVPSHGVWPNYFDTTGIPIKQGRPFTADEPRTSVIVSESFARKFWPEGSAVGAQIRFVFGDPESIRGLLSTWFPLLPLFWVPLVFGAHFLVFARRHELGARATGVSGA